MEYAKAIDNMDAVIIRGSGTVEGANARGLYRAECYGVDGKLKWSDDFKNVVMNVGKNLMLDSTLATAVTVVGPYLGLIGASSFSTIGTVVDTMASHAGWLEAGGTTVPLFTGSRQTCVWSAASSGAKALSTALSFAITTGGVAKGCFIVTGPNATTVCEATTGTLLSAGLFTGGDKTLAASDTLQVSYTLTL